MSRHRKIKALDFDDEYDDYFGALDDEDADDFEVNEDAFQAQYLSSGIDLNTSSNSISAINKNRQPIIDESKTSTTVGDNLSKCKDGGNENVADTPSTPPCPRKQETVLDSLSSSLTKIAIQHLDKQQWQMPLMEMDKRFRDKTYYKHYTDTYITSLRSKLGNFLADRQLLTNPMKYHRQREIDNYSKYSRICELLTDYYQSSGSGFFSFATPSPDEEIAIGCRLGTKAKSKPKAKPSQLTKENEQKTTRFEYNGKSNHQPSTSKESRAATTPKVKAQSSEDSCLDKIKKAQLGQDKTIQENHTAEQLDKLSKEYTKSLKIANSNKKRQQVELSTPIGSNKQNVPSTNQLAPEKSASIKKPKASSTQPKQLATLVERRQDLRRQLNRRNAEPSAQDLETFKKQSQQTVQEYNELTKSLKQRVNLVVVGHVDAGKSTLVGHMLYKLGQISGKQMHRFEVDSQRSGKASFKFAWAMDETAEERQRGVTIDIALTQFETPHRDVILLDAPGHVDFIPAVISGAAQADAALLVVDATRGEFETGFTMGGQTREHTFLVRSLGVKSLVVVVNKMDMVDWNWNRFVDIREQLKPFLKQVGFNLEEDVQFVACSGLSGDNILERRLTKAKKVSSHPQLEGDGGDWNSMPTLMEAVDSIKQPERMVDKPTRVFITDIFKGMSSGVFLGAKVVGGKLENKQKLILLPPGEPCEIKQIEVSDSSGKAQKAFAGDIVTVVATGIDMNKYYRGCMLCDPLIPCHVTNRFQARIIMFQNVSAILIKGTSVEVHINGTHESGEIRRLISLLNKNTGELIQRKPRCVAKNSSAIIQLRLGRVVCCELYEDNKDLGRFMLRSYGKTIAAGLITKIKSPKVEKRRTKMRTK